MRTILPAAIACLLAVPAMAGQYGLKLVNRSQAPVIRFYAARAGSNAWGRNILKQDTIEDGETVSVTVIDPVNTCFFDLKSVYESRQEVVLPHVNLCATRNFTLNP